MKYLLLVGLILGSSVWGEGRRPLSDFVSDAAWLERHKAKGDTKCLLELPKYVGISRLIDSIVLAPHHNDIGNCGRLINAYLLLESMPISAKD